MGLSNMKKRFFRPGLGMRRSVAMTHLDCNRDRALISRNKHSLHQSRQDDYSDSSFKYNKRIMATKTLVFLLVAMAGVVCGQSALKCYTCYSNTEPDCHDNYANSEYEKGCGTGFDQCFRQVSKSGSTKLTHRGCTTDHGCKTGKEAAEQATAAGRDYIYECCTGDLCNVDSGGATFGLSYALLMFMSLAIIMYQQ